MKFNEILIVHDNDAGLRLDVFLAKHYKEKSRTYFQKLIKKGEVNVNSKTNKTNYIVSANDKIELRITEDKKVLLKPEKIKLNIVFENTDIAIVNKDPEIVVHPSDDGHNLSGTLANALLGKYKTALSDVGGELRPGIVHRLDKDTSGLLIIAKNNQIHKYLVDLLKNRKINKTYITLVSGSMDSETGTIEAPLARSKNDYKKVVITNEQGGKNAITEFKILKEYTLEKMAFSLLEVKIITGRTHQIRVHLKSIGHPVVGDTVYGRQNINKLFSRIGLKRQFLHSAALNFPLPSGEIIDIKTKLPADLQEVLNKLTK